MNTISFEKFEVDEENRGITFSVASNLPYERYDVEREYAYQEVLVISEDAVDLHRLNDGAAVLWGHDTDDLLGIVDKAWIVEDKIFVKVRFSRNDEHADRVWKDILDGTIKNVSIGYAINHFREERKGTEIYRYVDNWMPYECSIVSVPADETVGIRKMAKKKKEANAEVEVREADTAGETTVDTEQAVEQTEQVEGEKVEQKEQEPEQADLLAELQAENDSLKARIKELEEKPVEPQPEEPEKPAEEPPVDASATNEEADEIKACGDALGVPKDEQERAIKAGMSAVEFKREFKNYTITKKEKTAMKFKEYLREGNFTDKFVLTRNAYSGFGGLTGEGGESLIGTETKPLVAALEKVIGVKGFRTMAGLTSNISIPVQSARNVIEQTAHLRDAATTSNPEFTPVVMSPVKLSGNTRIGKELLVQCNDDVEAFIVDSLTREIGYKIEDYLLGKVTTGATGSVTYSAINAIDWDDILAFEAAIGGYALETPAFVMSPSARAALKGITKAGNFPKFICEDNEVNGYRVNVSGCVGNDNIYFGDWSKLLLGIWGNGLEIMVNPYTFAKEGDVEIVASICVDAAVIQGDAFVVGAVEDSSSN